MIEPKELRIGNYVTDEFYDSFKTIIEVDSINNKGINLSIEDDGGYPELADRWVEPEYEFSKLFGIPLSEEILLRCGFEKEADHIFISQNNSFRLWGFAWTLQEFHITIGWVDVGVRSVKHLHQLQNLFFALTGKELELK